MEVLKTQRAAIEFLAIEGISLAEIHKRLKNAYGTSGAYESMVKRHDRRFRRSRNGRVQNVACTFI